MAKWASDAAIDGGLDYIGGATLLTVCSSQPTTYAEASSTFKLADVVIDTGDFTKANGDVSGRKTTIGQQANVPIDSSGTATHVALSISGTSTLVYITTCTSQVLTSGGTVTVPAWRVEIADPA